MAISADPQQARDYRPRYVTGSQGSGGRPRQSFGAKYGFQKGLGQWAVGVEETIHSPAANILRHKVLGMPLKSAYCSISDRFGGRVRETGVTSRISEHRRSVWCLRNAIMPTHFNGTMIWKSEARLSLPVLEYGNELAFV